MNALRMLMLASVLTLGSQLCACSQPAPPEPPREQHQELRRAIQEPIDRARAVEGELQKQQDALQRQLEDSGG